MESPSHRPVVSNIKEITFRQKKRADKVGSLKFGEGEIRTLGTAFDRTTS